MPRRSARLDKSSENTEVSRIFGTYSVRSPLNLHNFLLFVFDAKASFLKGFLVF
jgi:hypothetical protein